MTKKTDSKKPLQSFKASFGIEASVWPPNGEYGETEPKIRIGRSYRDDQGKFKTTTYFAAEELASQMQQCLKAIAYVKPELVGPLMKSLDEIAHLQWK